MRGIRPELAAVVLLARRRPGTVVGRRARGALGSAGLPILDAEPSDRVTYPEAVGAGMGPTTYEPSSPASAEVMSHTINESIEAFLAAQRRR